MPSKIVRFSLKILRVEVNYVHADQISTAAAIWQIERGHDHGTVRHSPCHFLILSQLAETTPTVTAIISPTFICLLLLLYESEKLRGEAGKL